MQYKLNAHSSRYCLTALSVLIVFRARARVYIEQISRLAHYSVNKKWLERAFIDRLLLRRRALTDWNWSGTSREHGLSWFSRLHRKDTLVITHFAVKPRADRRAWKAIASFSVGSRIWVTIGRSQKVALSVSSRFVSSISARTSLLSRIPTHAGDSSDTEVLTFKI